MYRAKFRVEITEKLKLTVEVEAENPHQAEQLVSDGWRKNQYILDADNFADVGFHTLPISDTECQ